MRDRNGLEICAPRSCDVCGAWVATRPDGSLRHHARWVSASHPRLGVVSCEGATVPHAVVAP